MGLKYPHTRGFLYSLTSATLLQGQEVWRALRGLKINVTIEGRDPVYGNGMIAFGRPSGTLKVEWEAKLLLDSFFEFQATHPQYMTEIFNPAYAFEQGVRRDRVELVAATIEGVEITGEGTDAAEASITGSALDVLMGRNKISVAQRQSGDVSAGNTGSDSGGFSIEASFSVGFG